MSSMHDEQVDEVAAAEAELKAAQEKLAAAKARQAAARGVGEASSATSTAQEATGQEAVGGRGGSRSQSSAGAAGNGKAQSAQGNAQGADGGAKSRSQGAGGAYAQGGGQVPPSGNQPPYGASGNVPPQGPTYGYRRQTYGQQAYNQQNVATKDHVAAGLLAIFLGALGVHKFYLGYNTSGFIMLAVTVLGGLFTFSIATWVVWIIAIIEGIIYLTKTQTEFEQIYVFNKREWF